MSNQNQHLQKILAKLPIVFFVFVFSFFVTTVYAKKNPPRVVWEENNIGQTIGNGGIITPTTVKFHVTEQLKNIDVFVVPEIKKYITVSPSHFANLEPNTAYEITLSYSLLPQAAEGTFDGTIHLKSGKATIPEVLKTSVTVDYGENVPSNDVITLSPQTLQKISGVTTDGRGIYFSESNPELQQIVNGKILALPPAPYLPNGFLGRVSAISVTGGQTFIMTIPASLNEMFTNASVNIDQALTEDGVSTSVALSRGVSIQGKDLNERLSNGIGNGLTAQLNDLVIYDHDQNPSTTSDQILLDGSVSINPQIHFSLDINNLRLQQMAFTVGLNENVNLEIKSRLQLLSFQGEKEFIRYSWSPIIIWVGWVPIVFTPNASLVARAEGSASVGVSVGVNQASSITVGFGFANGSWSPISDFSSSFTYSEPSFSAGINIKGQVGPRFELLLYGVVGPRTDIGAFGELDIDVLRTPVWQLFGGLEANAGVRLEIFDRTIADQQFPFLIQYRILIAEGGVAENGSIVGSVRDAVTQQPLPNSVIAVFRDGNLINTLLTNSSGQFQVSALAGAVYRFDISRTGYLPVNYENVTVQPNETRTLDVILQIDETNSGPGTVSGTVFNAVNGAGVPGLTINLRTGLNNTGGNIVRTTTTGAGGVYVFTNLPAGNYTAEASGTGYTNSYFPVLCIGNTTTGNQNGVITPTIPEGQIRIVLTWGATPSDLDSHFFGPLPDGTRFHMYWPYADSRGGSPWPTIVNLDLDDVTSFGPETTTLYQQINGVYKFSVHDYTNRNSTTSSQLSASQANVKVYRGNNLAASFNVPLNQPGTLWTVFEIEGDQIRPINQMSFSTGPTSLRSNFVGEDKLLLQAMPEKPAN